MRVYYSREIADQMNVSYQTVCTWVKKMGLTLPLIAGEVERLKEYYAEEKEKN